jgi:hypothetical protein
LALGNSPIIKDKNVDHNSYSNCFLVTPPVVFSMGNSINRSVSANNEFASKKYQEEKRLKEAQRRAARKRRRELRPGGWTIMARVIGYRKTGAKVGVDISSSDESPTVLLIETDE